MFNNRHFSSKMKMVNCQGFFLLLIFSVQALSIISSSLALPSSDRKNASTTTGGPTTTKSREPFMETCPSTWSLESTSTTIPTTTSTPVTPTPTPVSTESTVPTVPPGYVCPNLNGFFPIKPDQCLPNYYVCVSGSPSIGTCPPGSLFDPAVLYCVPEEQATCNFICPASNGFFPVPGYETEQCFNGYITCVAFNPFPTTCPSTSVFDPDLLFCVPPQDNGCVA